MSRLIGKNRAIDMMVTGRTLAPSQAHAAGIVDRMFPQAELEAKTLEYAQGIASGASFAAGRIKLAVNEGIEMPLSQGLERERKIAEQVFASEDAKEGIMAFVEKRKPAFKGK